MDPNSRMVMFGAAGSGEPPFNYGGTYVFSSPQTYNVYQWTVPDGTFYIQAKAWGSGASPDGFVNTFPGGSGGGGGFSTAVIPVTANETLYIGVGRASNNGGGAKSFGGNGGGFTSIFRGSTPLIIAGGGGGGAVNSTKAGGAGGGANGQNSSDHIGGSQTSGGTNAGYLFGGSGGGGGYYGGGGNNFSDAGAGGSGYINASGNLYKSYLTGSGQSPPSSGDPDYSFAITGGGLRAGFGGSGNNSGDSVSHGYGRLVIHILGSLYNPASAPSIPTPRDIIQTI